MRPSRVSDRVAGMARTRFLVGGIWRRARVGPASVAMVVCAVCALTPALGAPAHAAFLSPVSSFGSQGSGAGQLQAPGGVAVQPSNGAVYVADSSNARVEKFDANGNFIAAWGWGVADGVAQSEVCTSSCQAGIPGSGPGQFSRPTTIAIGAPPGPSANKVFVGDAGNNVVLKFDADGTFLGAIDGSTTPQGHFVSLAGVAVDQSGNLWTADVGTSNIAEFNAKGKFLQQWNDTHGSPSAIAVDSAHNAVYLITQGTTERWTLTGNYQVQIDRPVFFGPSFFGPSASALALDQGTGNLYVDHSGTPSDVTVYDHTGIQLDDLSLVTTNSQGLAFRSSGGKKFGQNSLYVSDASDNNVTIYGPQTTAGPPLVTSESVIQTGTTTATLAAGIVPLGHDTTCTFQYVADADFQASGYDSATNVACTPADLGSSFAYQAASASISGLTLGVTYHFRVVATNSAGTTTGGDQEFQAGPGAWAPFFRCPVDDPAMLATDGVTSLGFCLGSNSTHGSITIGNLTTTTGNTNLQAGLVGPSADQLSVIASPDGALVADPVEIPNTPVGSVTALTESAGTPSDFNLFAGIQTGVPIITLPIKIHLQNPALGPSCFIGSDQNPIVLHPQNTDLSNAKSIGGFFLFDPNGVPDLVGLDGSLLITGGVQGDDTFAVPGAQGCGPNGDGSLDAVVNAVVGLPSPAGNNHLVLDDASSGLAFPATLLTGQGTRTGQQFADDWHTAFGTTSTTTTSTSTTSTTGPTTTTTTTTTTAPPPTTTTTTTAPPTTTTTTTSTTSSTTTTPPPTTTTTTTSTTSSTTTSSTSPVTTSTSSTTTTTTSSTTSTTSSTTSTTSSTTTTTTPPLTKLAFTNSPGTTGCGGITNGVTFTPPASAPFSGEIDSDLACSAKIADLGLGCLYLGGGGATSVPPGATPDGATNIFDISGTNLLASKGTSNLNCTKGAGPSRHCIGGTNTGAACTTDGDCGGFAGSCALDANCFFAAPLPIVNGSLSTCIVNVIQTDASGTGDIATGTSNVTIPLSSRVFLTSNSASPCPKCVSGSCNYGPGTTCSAGSNSLGTSQDCPPPAAAFLAPLAVTLSPLTTGAVTKTGASGNFCPSPPAAAPQRTNGAFGKTTAQCIKESGSPAGDLTDGLPHPSKLGSVFCIPATGNAAIDPAADLPGPGAFSITGNAQALP